MNGSVIIAFYGHCCKMNTNTVNYDRGLGRLLYTYLFLSTVYLINYYYSRKQPPPRIMLQITSYEVVGVLFRGPVHSQHFVIYYFYYYCYSYTLERKLLLLNWAMDVQQSYTHAGIQREWWVVVAVELRSLRGTYINRYEYL